MERYIITFAQLQNEFLYSTFFVPDKSAQEFDIKELNNITRNP